MQRKVQAAVWIVAASSFGCTVGAPPGFSPGDRWAFPLIGPLEDGLLVTPVSVKGHGPYLFAIDPDANVTAIDQQVAVEAGLLVGTGPHRIDESEVGRTRFYAELLDLRIASLTVDRRQAMVFPNGLYDTDGRHINGVLGRDVIADSLVFGFDRDHGIATLSTVKAFEPPPEAIAIKYESVSSRSSDFVSSRSAVGFERSAGDTLPQVPGPAAPADPTGMFGPPPVRTTPELARLGNNDFEREMARSRPPVAGDVVPVPRRLARAQIGDARVMMHLDLGAVTSQLPDGKWSAARLEAGAAKLRLVDEAASVREVSKAGIAPGVALGAARAERVAFVPFADKRWATEGVDGALGLDFFGPYAVYANWDATTYYLKPRGDTGALLAARLGRWGSDLPTCPHPGCITIEVVRGNGTVGLKIARDKEAANRPLEVYVGVTPAAGRSAAPLVVELSPGVDQLIAGVPVEYAGARLEVLDASPFPRACVGDRGCLAMLGGPIAGTVELSPLSEARSAAVASAPPPPADGAAPRSVAIEKLHRITGDPAIPPSADALKAAAGKPIGVAIIKMCVTAEGKVESTKLVKSSGIAAYDDQLQAAIRASWSFEPVDGAPSPACATVTFVNH